MFYFSKIRNNNNKKINKKRILCCLMYLCSFYRTVLTHTMESLVMFQERERVRLKRECELKKGVKGG